MLTIDSKIKDLAKNPQAAAICEKYGITFSDKRSKMAFGISVRALSAYPQAGITPEKLAAMEKELEEANLE